MRIVAAIFVVAIHTLPFAQINPRAEVIFTRTIARVGVPFFFMIIGFFVLRNQKRDFSKISRYLFKILFLYLVATFIYIPIIIYSKGYPTTDVVRESLKMFFFDGTFYHLWYFPAAIIGLIIVTPLVNIIRGFALLIVTILYIFGLLGDSYYFISHSSPFLSNIYNCLFRIFDYTRNGIFFAPMYIYLGSLISLNRRGNRTVGYAFVLFALSSILMILESLYIHSHFELRHDSMYIFLPFVVFSLFEILKQFSGKRSYLSKDVSMLTYIIHPFFIVLVRFFVKFFPQYSYIVERNYMLFIVVAITSLIFSYIYALIKNSRRRYA